MTDEIPAYERKLFADIVHGLRTQGWSRLEAEGEALDRIEKRRTTNARKPL